MSKKLKALQMIALGMAFGAFNGSMHDHAHRYQKKSKSKKETLPEWTVFRNVYSASDTFIDISENVPTSAFILFTCRALNKKNAIKKAKKAGFL